MCIFAANQNTNNMKNFAFPLGVKCTSETELKKCHAIIEAIGDRRISDESFSHAYPYLHIYRTFTRTGLYKSWSGVEEGMYYIDHFDHELIRDIAAACTNDTWQDGELCIENGGIIRRHDGSLSKHAVIAPCPGFRRPTLSEICEHHGYEIKGRDIVKKVSEPVKSEYPKVMLVSVDNLNWHKRVVFMKKNETFIAWNNAETMEAAAKSYGASSWEYAKDIEPEPPTLELTIDEIAEKYGVKPEQIKIKKQ